MTHVIIAPTQGVKGIWTPWAEVLCTACHGNTFNRGFGDIKVLTDAEMVEREQLIDVGEYQGITPCDKCGRPIVIDESIATEHNMMLDLQAEGITARMAQTGGMCDALEIDRQCGGYYLMTAESDFCLGEFDHEGEWGEELSIYPRTYAEMMDEIRKLPDLVRTTEGGETE